MLEAMALNSLDREMVTGFRGRLESLLGERLRDLRVFGSRVRGDARPDSDLDVFVLVDHRDRATWKQIVRVAEDVTIEYDFARDLSPLVMDEAQFADLRDRERRLARDVLTEGISA